VCFIYIDLQIKRQENPSSRQLFLRLFVWIRPFDNYVRQKVVEAIYLRLHTEYGLARIIPPRLSLLPFVMEFKKLEEVRKGPEDQMKTTDTLLERIHRCSIYAAGGL